MTKNSKHNGAQYHCTNCLHGFPTDVSRDEHESYCVANDVVRIEMPSWNPYIRYSKGQYQLKVPFAMYADFESLLVKPCKEEEERGIVNMHEPSGWCIKTVFAHGKLVTQLRCIEVRIALRSFANT